MGNVVLNTFDLPKAGESTEEGLDQEFNSLDAQRQAAEACIQSQRQFGWTLVAQRYDDGGFTGANLDRPALQRLLEDVEARRIQCVVVYKVDRLSRSLLDFARLIDETSMSVSKASARSKRNKGRPLHPRDRPRLQARVLRKSALVDPSGLQFFHSFLQRSGD